MIATQIHLTEQEHDSLQTITLKTGKTFNELIRQALEKLIAEFDTSARLKKMRAARGMWKHRDDLPDFEEMRRAWERFSIEKG
jgi:lipase chaperone LimK